jgi:predicted dehydrogenase
VNKLTPAASRGGYEEREGTMTTAPKIAVVGLGIWGKNHALTYADYDKCDLALVCDADAGRARTVGEDLGVPWTTDLAEVAASDADGVSIATPDHLHTDVTLQMLAAGKNIFLEKPLATSLEDAQRLTTAASQSGLIAMVDFQNRWNPAFINIKASVSEGQVGAPVMGYVRLSDSIDVAQSWLSWAGSSGPEWFLFPHTIDIVRWIIGEEPVSVYALGKRGILSGQGIDCWDAIQALIQFESCFFTFETSWVVPAGSPSVVDSRFVLYGETGKVDYDWAYNGLSFVRDRVEYPWIPIGTRDRYGHLTHFVYEPMRHFADCLAGTASPETSFDDGLRNVRVIDAVRRSLLEKRPVELPR